MQGPVSGWQQGSEPSWMSMFIYVPDNVKPNPPILVALHYCGGTAAAVFSLAQNGGVVSAADQNGFIILLPQTAQNCWDVATTPSLTHDGGGDTKAVVDQVNYTIDQYGANADRVYAMGTSGGAMMAEGLIAVYPDVFKGGVEFSGVPAGCWAVNDPDGQWSSPCANGEVTHTAQEWGDMVRDMYPGYSGFRPRIQLWHGTGDSTINFTNQTEAIKQWTNILGLPADPTTTSNATVNGVTFTHDEWKDACDMTVLDVFTEPNGPHNTSANMTGQYSMAFLALDMAGDTDPQAASSCSMPSGGSSSGGAPSGGAPSGGASSGGASSGGAPSGGMGGMGQMPNSGGSPATGGMPGPDGMPAAGGMGNPVTPVPTGTVTPGPGGTVTPGPGGSATPVPGATAVPTAPTTQGSAPAPGPAGTGVPTATPVTSMGPVPGAGGSPGTASLGTGGADVMANGSPPADAAGCGCNMVRNTSVPLNALALAGLFVGMFVRRRSRR